MYTQFNKQNTLHIFQLLLGCCKAEKQVYWELVRCVTSCWFFRSNALTARYPVWKGRGWTFCQIALWPWDDDILTTQPNMGVSSYPTNPQNEYTGFWRLPYVYIYIYIPLQSESYSERAYCKNDHDSHSTSWVVRDRRKNYVEVLTLIIKDSPQPRYPQHLQHLRVPFSAYFAEELDSFR